VLLLQCFRSLFCIFREILSSQSLARCIFVRSTREASSETSESRNSVNVSQLTSTCPTSTNTKRDLALISAFTRVYLLSCSFSLSSTRNFSKKFMSKLPILRTLTVPYNFLSRRQSTLNLFFDNSNYHYPPISCSSYLLALKLTHVWFYVFMIFFLMTVMFF